MMELDIRADLAHSFQDRSFVIWSGGQFHLAGQFQLEY